MCGHIAPDTPGSIEFNDRYEYGVINEENDSRSSYNLKETQSSVGFPAVSWNFTHGIDIF